MGHDMREKWSRDNANVLINLTNQVIVDEIWSYLIK